MPGVRGDGVKNQLSSRMREVLGGGRWERGMGERMWEGGGGGGGLSELTKMTQSVLEGLSRWKLLGFQGALWKAHMAH